MRKIIALLGIIYIFLLPITLAIGATDTYQIQDGQDDVQMTETLALLTDDPFIILKDYDISYKIGLRFININISRGTLINEAILSVYCKYDFPNGTGTVTIYGLKVGDAPLLDDPEDLMGPLTENFVIWNISDVKGPDAWHNITITPIIQEIINHDNWAQGNDLALIILTEMGNIRRQFTSADYMNPAKLYITYGEVTPPGAEYTLLQTYKGYEIYNVSIGGLPYEDLTNFTEVDPENELSVTTYQIDWTNFNRYGGDAYLYRFYGTNYFGDLTHNFTVYFTTIEAGDTSNQNIIFFWQINEVSDLVSSDRVFLYARQVADTDNLFTLVFAQLVGGSASVSWIGTYQYASGNEYYITVDRSGAYWRIKAYSDENRTNLLEDSGDLAGDSSVLYDYLQIAGQANQASDIYDWSTGYLKNLWIGGEAQEAEWWIEIWANGTQVNGNFTSLEDAISYIDNVLISPEEQPYNPDVGGYEVIPRRYVKLGVLGFGLGFMMVGMLGCVYRPTVQRASIAIILILIGIGLLVHITQI